MSQQNHEKTQSKREKRKGEESSKDKLKTKVTKIILTPSQVNMLAINELFSQINFNDEVKGLSQDVLQDELKEQNKLLFNGDMSRVEAMLLDQAHTLQAIFALYTMNLSKVEITDHLELYSRIALKAQNQCRQTIATLGELRNPRRATFVKQQNNAVNQQINEGINQKRDSGNPKNSETNENKLLETINHERLDLGTQETAIDANSELETMGEINRPQK